MTETQNLLKELITSLIRLREMSALDLHEDEFDHLFTSLQEMQRGNRSANPELLKTILIDLQEYLQQMKCTLETSRESYQQQLKLLYRHKSALKNYVNNR